LRPGSEPKLLTTPDVRRKLLFEYGVDEVCEIPFDEALSRKSPEAFVRDVLVGKLGAAVVVVGENFRFGYRASGGVEELRCFMREAGGEAYPVPVYAALGKGVSSTRIRDLLLRGEVREAAWLLGRPYLLRGEVVAGDGRGRVLGFPTANIVPEACALVPGRGVYAGYVRVGEERYEACTNIGVAPTFDRQESKVETHILGFDRDLYGEVVSVTFVERLRPERRFAGAEELKQQVARDVAEVGRIVGGGA
jgi:riboflavin kinase/FMN adenylyltransferase